MGSFEQNIIKKKATVLDKVDCIHELYNNFYINEGVFKKYLRDNDDMKVYYLFDITDTMRNTFNILKTARNLIGKECSKEEHILTNIGLMQLIYVHQDLMDELLRIFKIDNSIVVHKREYIRLSRNELVGHPICRNKEGILTSTVVWDWSNEHGTISYLKRPNGKMTNQTKKTISLIKLLDDHEEYINRCLDEILKKQIQHLKEYRNKLKNVKKLLNNNKTCLVINITVDNVNGLLQRVNNYRGYFSKQNLLSALRKKECGNRYVFFIKEYIDIIMKIMDELDYEINNIQDLLKGVKKNEDYSQVDFRRIDVINDLDFVNKEKIFTKDEFQININYNTLKNKYSYYLGKLFEKRFKKDIFFLERELVNYPEMLQELKHMEEHWTGKSNDYLTNMEYYSAILYLEFLMDNVKVEDFLD